MKKGFSILISILLLFVGSFDFAHVAEKIEDFKVPEVYEIRQGEIMQGDREFDIILAVDNIENLNLLDLNMYNQKEKLVARTKESHFYHYYDDSSISLIFKLELIEGENILNGDRFIIKVDSLVDKKFNKNWSFPIYINDYPKIIGLGDINFGEEMKVEIKGMNFRKDAEYRAVVNDIWINEKKTSEYKLTYLNSETLLLNLGANPREDRYHQINMVIYSSDEERDIGQLNLDARLYGEPTMVKGDIEYISLGIKNVNVNFDLQYTIQDPSIYEVFIVNKNGSIVGIGTNMKVNTSTDIGAILNTDILMEQVLPGEYEFVVKHNGIEIKNRSNSRILIKVGLNPEINNVVLNNSIKNNIVGLDREIGFILEKPMNIKDIKKINVYLRNSYGVKTHSLVAESIKLKESTSEVKDYIGVLKSDNEMVIAGKYELVVDYDNKFICKKEIEITDKKIAKVYRNMSVESNTNTYVINYYESLNINPEDYNIVIKDSNGKEMKGNIIKVNYEDPTNTTQYNLTIQTEELFEDNVRYQMRISIGEIILVNDSDLHGSRLESTSITTSLGQTLSNKFENDIMSMDITSINTFINVRFGEKLVGHFYKIDKSQNNKPNKFFKKLELGWGTISGKSGIVYPAEKFIEFPEGSYQVFITNENGDIFFETNFSIFNKVYKDIELYKDKIYKIFINEDADYTKDKEVKINIVGKGYTHFKVSNELEKLKSVKFIPISSEILHSLENKDGKKKIYIQLSDLNGQDSEVFTKEIYLDTKVPEIIEAKISKINNVKIGDKIWFEVKTNERVKSNVLFYINGVEISKIGLNYNQDMGEQFLFSKEITIEHEFDLAKIYIQDFAGNVSEVKEFNIK